MRYAGLLTVSALCATLSNHALAADQPSAPQGARPSGAQQAPAADEGVGDIIVTAQRREENVQRVPIAISVFSADQLATRGVSSALDIGQFVPNMIAQNNTGLGSANAYYIRGLGNTETIPTFDPPVGTYVDDIYLSRQNANNLSLFDIERVEVLRGPQGTLFGRNTTGGAISFVMRQPSFDRIGGYAEIGYGSYNKRIARGSIDLPVSSRLAVKLSAYWQNDDGYARNITTGERTNDDDGLGVRVGLRAEPADGVRWNASYAYIEADGIAQLNFDCNPAAPAQCDGRFVSTGLRRGRHLPTSPYLPLAISGRKALFGLGNYTQSHLLTSNLAFDIAPETTLSLITGYVSQAQQYAMDFSDGRALPSLSNPVPPVMGYSRGGFDILNDGISKQFSQEVKLNGSLGDGLITYVGGFYYIKERNRTDFADLLALSPATTLLLADRTLRNTMEAYAGYAQADLNLGQFTFTAGLRYTDETKTISVQDNRPSCNDGTVEATCLSDVNLVAPSGVRIPLRQKAKQWTPRFVVNFKPQDGLLLFVSATRGFKSGGWNARGSAPNTFLPFGPEKIWSYEAGVKADLFNRKVRAAITVYQENVDDLQTPSALVSPTGAITFLTRNFADYRNRGIEAELTVAPVRGLNLFANVGYQDDKYIIDRSAPAFDIYGIQSVAAQQAACQALITAGAIPGGTGTAPCAAGIVTARGTISTPVRTPDFTVSLGGSYRAEIGGGYTLVPSANASWHSDQEVQTSNYTIYSGSITGTNGTYPANPFAGTFLQGSFSPAAWLVNAGLALNAPEDRWQLSAGCTNCFDKAFVQSSLANTTYINQPRMWMIRAKYNF